MNNFSIYSLTYKWIKKGLFDCFNNKSSIYLSGEYIKETNSVLRSIIFFWKFDFLTDLDLFMILMDEKILTSQWFILIDNAFLKTTI